MSRILKGFILIWITFVSIQCSPKTRTKATVEREDVRVEKRDVVSEPMNARESVVATAYEQLGSPYRYGGSSKKGYDCSGLIYTSFLEHDFSLPRTAHEMLSYGKKIDQKQVLPGDLAFFKNVGRKIDHVAMVYKNDRSGIWLLHSTSSKGVILQSLDDSSYWSKRLVQFNRIIADGK